jgi:hypothetical protein
MNQRWTARTVDERLATGQFPLEVPVDRCFALVRAAVERMDSLTIVDLSRTGGFLIPRSWNQTNGGISLEFTAVNESTSLIRAQARLPLGVMTGPGRPGIESLFRQVAALLNAESEDA